MASSNRRASQDWESQRDTVFPKRRNGSMDIGRPSATVASSRRLSTTDASAASHVKATLIAQGPPVAFFGSCVINDVLYIHGGVRARADHAPSNQMFTLQGNTWTDITTADSPILSYHRCVVMGNGQYIVTIGGWDGSKRKADVFVFEVATGTWHSTNAPGFPSDGGLNNHAVAPMKKSESSILVIGRDGSLRMQRKHGDAYCLRGDPATRSFRWEQYPIGVASRSGHSLVGYGSSMYIIGGRADLLIQRYPGLPVENQNVCDSFHADLKQMIDSSLITPMKKLPSTRKDHTSISCGGDLTLVYGGETFDGRSRDPSNEVFVVSLGAHEHWYSLGHLEFGRQGHAMVQLGGQLLVHGGLGKDGVCGETFLIELIR